MLYFVLLCCGVLCCVVFLVLCCVVLCCVVLCCVVLCCVVLCCVGNMRGMVSQAGAPSIVSWQPNAPDSGIMPPDIKGAQSYQRYFTEISHSDALASLLLLH